MDTDSEEYSFLDLDAKRIADLARYILPDDAPYFGKAAGVKTPEAERMAICLNDAKFGWHFVNSYLHARKPMPFSVTDDCLCTAFAHIWEGVSILELTDAIALTHPKNTAQSNLLKGLIMCRDISLSRICELMHISERTLKLFCELFFNVRIRLNEPGFISSLLYPKTKFDTYRADYSDNEDPGLVLMRAGYKYGANEVFRLAGVDRLGDAKEPTQELCDDFENLVMQNGVTLARAGFLNSKNNSGIAHAKAALAAKKKANSGNDVPAGQVMGLSALSMGQGIMEVVKGLQAPDVAERRILQTQHLELQARREKAAKAEESNQQ
jgi:hypothetical protein